MTPWSEKAKTIRKATYLTVGFSALTLSILFLLSNEGVDPFVAGFQSLAYFMDITKYIFSEGSIWDFQNVQMSIYLLGISSLISIVGLTICLALFLKIKYMQDKYGDSRIATATDVSEMGLLEPKESNGFILGKLGRKRIESPVVRHSLIVAPTRSGKTAGLVIPNILNFTGSMIIIDPKGELYADTSAAVAKRGYKVRLLDWSNPKSPDTWSPVDLQTLPDDFVELEKVVDRLTATLFPTQKNEDFWTKSGRKVFSAIMLFRISEAKRKSLEEYIEVSIASVLDLLTNFEDVREEEPKKESPIIGAEGANEWVDEMGNLLLKYIKIATQYRYPARVVQDLQSLHKESFKTRANIVSTVLSQVAQYRSEALRHTMSKSSFTFEDLRSEKTALYIKFPQKDAKAYGPCTSLFLEFFFAYVVDTKKAKEENNILILADEFPSLPAIPLMLEFLSKGAGMGAMISIIIQDFSQVISIYGSHEFDSIKSNCTYWVIYAQNNLNVQKEISEMIGNRTISEKQKDLERKEGLRLLSVNDIGSMPFGTHLILVQNYHNRPIIADTFLFFEDKNMCKMLEIKTSKRKA